MITEKHLQLIAAQLDLKGLTAVQHTYDLLQEGATVPFIARYRKERTQGLDEVQIAAIKEGVERYAELEKRRASILSAIEEQGKLTETLRKRIEATYDATTLEDLYLPYKRKRKTKADKARELGLQPLADRIWEQAAGSPESWAASFVTDGVADIGEALQGAKDIIAERVSEDQEVRERVRNVYAREAMVRAKVVRGKEEEASKYKDYFDYEEPLKKCPSHRLLAIRRGEEEGLLRVYVKPEDEAVYYTLDQLLVKAQTPSSQLLQEAIREGYKRLLGPSIENEYRNSSKASADEEAITVFAENLRQLLLAPPLGRHRVLGIDPGYRTGCKVVALSEQGDLLQHSAIYPHPPQQRERDAAQLLQRWVHEFGIDTIAIGNGTASRETERFVRGIDFERRVEVFVVSESGASIYSASEIAREEFPGHDVTVRGAISIGRRLMDPLAELVKIDPKSIGVGQYQHDVDQKLLKSRLDQVVESCVNTVGVNVNTASKHLLTYVSGLSETLAQNIVQYRSTHGDFKSRKALMDVPRMGAKTFEQAAGFLRIREGEHPLDNTAVHPESYHIVEQMAQDQRCTVQDLIRNPLLRKHIDLRRYVTDSIGLPTLNDILQELAKPGLDPRGEAKAFQFTEGIESIHDLREGMRVNGIVVNITKFGAFVDIGVKESGLVHVSQMANRFVKDPMEVVKLQQAVTATVIGIDLDRKRIQLSLKA